MKEKIFLCILFFIPCFAQEIEHIVAKGETLQEIAKKYYHCPLKWRRIYKANRQKIRNPNRIYPGLRLVIPIEPQVPPAPQIPETKITPQEEIKKEVKEEIKEEIKHEIILPEVVEKEPSIVKEPLIEEKTLTVEESLIEKKPLTEVIEVSEVKTPSEPDIKYEEGVAFITLTRVAEKIERLPTNVTVITAEDIKTYGYQTLGDILDRQASLNLYKIGTLGSLTKPYIRGTEAENILILIDGRPQNGISLATDQRLDITAIVPLSSIERIEIVRGAGSCLYGANAMAGIINIITKKAKSETPKLEFSTQLESFDTHMYRLSFERKTDLISYFINAEKDVTAGWRHNSDYDKLALFAKLNLNLKRFGEIELNTNNLFSYRGIPGLTDVPFHLWDGKRERAARTPRQRLNKKNMTLQLKYNVNIRDKKISAQTYITDDHLNITNPDARTLGAMRESYNNSKQFGIETSINLTPNITAGISFHEDRANVDVEQVVSTFPALTFGKDNFNKYANNFGLFAEISYPKVLVPKLTLITSIRYDRHSMFGPFINYRISAIYPLLESLDLSTNFGTAYRAPTFLDLYWPEGTTIKRIGDRTIVLTRKGNPDLKPEKGITFDVGLRYKIKNSIFEFTLYQHEYENMIDWVDDFEKLITMSQNRALAKIQGAEISVSQTITPYLSYNFNLTSLYKLVKDAPEKEYELAKYSPLYKANYSLILQPGYGFTIIPTISYESERYAKDGKKDKIEPYTVFDLCIAKTIGMGRIYFKINNIFDTRYLRRGGYPLPGRYYAGGIEISF